MSFRSTTITFKDEKEEEGEKEEANKLMHAHWLGPKLHEIQTHQFIMSTRIPSKSVGNSSFAVVKRRQTAC